MSVVQHAAGSVFALPIERQVLLERVRMRQMRMVLLVHHAHHVVWVGRRGSARPSSGASRTTFTGISMVKRYAIHGINQVTVEAS